jgi:hypothetical protein
MEDEERPVGFLNGREKPIRVFEWKKRRDMLAMLGF